MDHDGLVNLYEHWMSTNPHNADTDRDNVSDLDEFNHVLLRILFVQRSGTTCCIRFPTVRGFYYEVDYSDRLGAEDWIALPGSYVAGKDSVVEVVDETSAAESSRFYRVRLTVPPLSPELPPELVWIPSGTFVMGSPTNEVDRHDWEGPQTAVTISRGFLMGKYEVTQGEYLAVMGNNPSAWRCLEFLHLPASPYLWADKSAPATARRFYRAIAMEAPTNMVFIPPGTFRMGSPPDEVERYDWEGPQTAVTISRGFWMGKYEVTQGEYLDVMGNNPSALPRRH